MKPKFNGIGMTGGISGHGTCIILNCYNTGNIEAKTSVGGIFTILFIGLYSV